MVLVDRDENNRNVSELRAEGHQVIIADAAVEETLDLAGIDRAAGVLAITDSDAINLQVALAVRRRRPDIRVVVRLLSRELSNHVTERGDAFAASSVDVGGAAFAAAALAELV
jgi:voltage-gated potassium channel